MKTIVNAIRIKRAYEEAHRAARREATAAALALGFGRKGVARAVDRELTEKLPNPGHGLNRRLERLPRAESSRLKCLLAIDYFLRDLEPKFETEAVFIGHATDILQQELSTALRA